MAEILSFLDGLPPLLVYLALGAGAATENVVPPVPADTFVLLGGFVAALGRADPVWVFAATWGGNVGSALLVYWLGYHYGRPFFEHGWGRRLLDPEQLRKVSSFYERWGVRAIFLSRFLPGFRAVVPVFAGVSHLKGRYVAPPVLVASALWYGGLVWLGSTAGRNLDQILGWVRNVNRTLLIVALLLLAVLGVWGGRSRHGEGDEEG